MFTVYLSEASEAPDPLSSLLQTVWIHVPLYFTGKVGFDPSIRRHSGIWGAADETVLNIVRKKYTKKGGGRRGVDEPVRRLEGSYSLVESKIPTLLTVSPVYKLYETPVKTTWFRVWFLYRYLVHARREDGTVHGIEDLPYFKVNEKLFIENKFDQTNDLERGKM
jgi:hypothetical protein